MPALPAIPIAVSGLASFLNGVIALIIRLLAVKIIFVLITIAVALIFAITGVGETVVNWGLDQFFSMIGMISGDFNFNLQEIVDTLPNEGKFALSVLRVPEIIGIFINTVVIIISGWLLFGIYLVTRKMMKSAFALDYLRNIK